MTEGWAVEAACIGTTVDFFDWDQRRKAIAICETCPVQVECLQDALSRGPKDDAGGVWGGKTKDQRDAMRPKGRRRQIQGCGTYGGYRRHVISKETPCPPCREANRVRQQYYRDKNRGAA